MAWLLGQNQTEKASLPNHNLPLYVCMCVCQCVHKLKKPHCFRLKEPIVKYKPFKGPREMQVFHHNHHCIILILYILFHYQNSFTIIYCHLIYFCVLQVTIFHLIQLVLITASLIRFSSSLKVSCCSVSIGHIHVNYGHTFIYWCV